MFQFPAFAPTKSGYPAFNWMGCPIRTSPGQGLFAPNRCFSQLTASFFASLSLGIHRPPFCFPYFYIYVFPQRKYVCSICFLSFNMSKTVWNLAFQPWRIRDSNP